MTRLKTRWSTPPCRKAAVSGVSAKGTNVPGGRISSVPERAGMKPARTIASSRSEEHTSELQSLMRISYAVFCLKKKRNNNIKFPTHDQIKSSIQTTSYKEEHYLRCNVT